MRQRAGVILRIGGNLCKGDVAGRLHELLELAVGDRRSLDEEWIDRDPMDGRLFRIMLVRSHREGTARNQDHSDGPGMLARLGVDGIVIELNRAHSAIPQEVERLGTTDRRMLVRWITQSLYLFAGATGASLHHLERLLDAQRSTHLAWRIIFKRLEEAADERYGRHHRPKFFAPPTAIQHRLVLITFPRIHPQIGHQRNVGGFFRTGKQVALNGLETEFPVIVTHGREVTVVGEVEELLPRSLHNVAFQERLEVVTIKVGLEGLITYLHAIQEFALYVWLAGGCEKCRQEVFTRDNVVDDTARLDRAGPLRNHRHAKSAFVRRALLAAERGVAAIRPGKGLGAVIAGEDHDRSEEHTSELQSPCNLVCRLLLEKKKNRSSHCSIRPDPKYAIILRREL